jgi:hypothetical protein
VTQGNEFSLWDVAVKHPDYRFRKVLVEREERGQLAYAAALRFWVSWRSRSTASRNAIAGCTPG